MNLFKNEKDENRKRYKTGIVILVLLVFIGGSLLGVLNYLFIFDDELNGIIVGIMGLSYRLGLIYITIWYGIKSSMKKVWAWVLGLSTLLPLMWLISIVYLLSRKSPIAENA